MHIALFGASFDPPHTAHKVIAEQLLDQQLADQVWLVPVKQHPFGKVMSLAKHRLEMVKLMMVAMGRPDTVLINEYELMKDTPSYSFNTLQAMTQKFPEHTFSWVIGSDNLAHFPEWSEAEKLLSLFTVYVYPRKGFSTDHLLPGMRLITDVKEVEISSTSIRDMVKMGKDITGLVEPQVAQYIKENELYNH